MIILSYWSFIIWMTSFQDVHSLPRVCLAILQRSPAHQKKTMQLGWSTSSSSRMAPGTDERVVRSIETLAGRACWALGRRCWMQVCERMLPLRCEDPLAHRTSHRQPPTASTTVSLAFQVKGRMEDPVLRTYGWIRPWAKMATDLNKRDLIMDIYTYINSEIVKLVNLNGHISHGGRYNNLKPRNQKTPIDQPPTQVIYMFNDEKHNFAS